MVCVPLTESVAFKAKLQVGNKIQVPRLIRWQYKLEPTQILKVDIGQRPVGIWQALESFYAKMGKDGRIQIPKLALEQLQEKFRIPSLEGYVMEFTLQPA